MLKGEQGRGASYAQELSFKRWKLKGVSPSSRTNKQTFHIVNHIKQIDIIHHLKPYSKQTKMTGTSKRAGLDNLVLNRIRRYCDIRPPLSALMAEIKSCVGPICSYCLVMILY